MMMMMMMMTMTTIGIVVVASSTANKMSSIHLEPRDGRPHVFVDDSGREIVFHGTSAVVKGPPWYPDHTEFSKDISMSKEDFEWMNRIGLNFLRLGVMWPGTEPVRGDYNETYLDQIEAVVDLAAQHGVYVMLDVHQDGLSEFFCGEGLPNWAVRRIEGPAKWDEPFHHPFPAPYDKFENSSCFYNEPKHNNALFPTRQACDNHKHGPSFGESTYETSQGYQALWSNWNGTADAFAAMWGHVAKRFSGRPEVVGLNVVNEPFAGDFYHNPLIMVPWPSPTNADRVNLQPVYDKVNAAVRAVDEDGLLFVAGVTWGDLGSGFTSAPGGDEYANRTVMTYHYYDPPQFSAEEQIKSHAEEARRLGTGAMMTETEAIWAPEKFPNMKANLTDACDSFLTGWADWGWKSFVRQGPHDDDSSPSQYYEWGAPKTGHGVDWNGKDDPPAYYFKYLARTYAQRVFGILKSMSFSTITSEFKLQYTISNLENDIPTEIFVFPERYGKNGPNITASASIGAVDVVYDGNSLVKIVLGDGIKVGSEVSVRISKTQK